MATHTDRQLIPVIRDDARDADSSLIAAIIAQLDASLIIGKAIGCQLSLLPASDRYAEVDHAVRLWASAHDFKIQEWGHWSRPGHWIEGYTVMSSKYDQVVTVHTPEGLRCREPVDDGCGPVEWRPSDAEVQL